jgi:DNA-binding CsgD family transcriptional regulator/PAS domain-containing protein
LSTLGLEEERVLGVSHVIPPHALSDLIGSIYDCALDPSRWGQTLRNIKDALDGQIAVVSLINVQRHRPLLMKTAGLNPGHLPMYFMHVNEIRDLIRASLALPMDDAHVASRDLPPGYMDASPYFQASRKRGIVDIMQFILIHEAPHFFSGFSILRHERQGVITDREIEIGKLLLPHLRRAMTISKMLDLRTVEGARMAQTLDALRCAVLLTDERGTILHANRAAERMLEDGDPIRSAKGILQAKLSSATSGLHAALAVAARDQPCVSRTGAAIRLTAPAMPPAVAHILPLTESDVRTRLEPAAVAAVFICVPVDEQDGAAIAAAAFGLTPAQTRVLKNLLAGRTLAETATALGITRFTANAHLDQIFVKTGVSRQADLIRLAFELVSPARSNA